MARTQVVPLRKYAFGNFRSKDGGPHGWLGAEGFDTGDGSGGDQTLLITLPRPEQQGIVIVWRQIAIGNVSTASTKWDLYQNNEYFGFTRAVESLETVGGRGHSVARATVPLVQLPTNQPSSDNMLQVISANTNGLITYMAVFGEYWLRSSVREGSDLMIRW